MGSTKATRPDLTVVVAPNCLRGSATSTEVARALAAGVRQASPEQVPVILPLTDGGNGTLEVLTSARGGRLRSTEAFDALGRRRRTAWLALDDSTAVVESAAICGFADLRTDQLRPLRASSAGVGEVIASAITEGATTVMLGLGGTAITDGGAGALNALGARFLDKRGTRVTPDPSTLRDIVRIDLDPARRLLSGVTLCLLPDVRTPLASAVGLFGPQKGLEDTNRPVIVAGLEHLAGLLSDAGAAGARDRLHSEWFGAGGGIGFGLSCVTTPTIRSGAEELLDLVDPDGLVMSADLAITAEGRVDLSTWQGKLPGAIAARRAERGLRTALVAARLETDLPSGLIDFHPLTGQSETSLLTGDALRKSLAVAGAECVTSMAVMAQ
jgi:glycerate kinase